MENKTDATEPPKRKNCFVRYETPPMKNDSSIAVTFEFKNIEGDRTQEEVIEDITNLVGHLPPIIANYLMAILVLSPIDENLAISLSEMFGSSMEMEDDGAPMILPPGLGAKEIESDFLVAYT